MKSQWINTIITFFHDTVLTAFGGKVRSDRRCGKEFPLQDGAPSECDPTSENPCCSKWGFCGPDADHCACPECVDYRPQEQKGWNIILMKNNIVTKTFS